MQLKYLNFYLHLKFVFAGQQILNPAAYSIIFYAAAVSSFLYKKRMA